MKYGLEIFLIALIVIFGAIFLIQNAGFQSTGQEAWGGSDDGASSIIEETGYEPWFSPVWEPPSGEIESLLFCLQAAIGSVIIGYVFGYWRGRKVNA